MTLADILTAMVAAGDDGTPDGIEVAIVGLPNDEASLDMAKQVAPQVVRMAYGRVPGRILHTEVCGDHWHVVVEDLGDLDGRRVH